MKIPYSHVAATCKIGQGADCCRYLFSSLDGFGCAKVVTHLKVRLDQRAEREEMTALGDNCPGWNEERSKEH